jgi:hypothetical protein
MWRLFPSSRRTRWGACWSQGSSVVQSCRLKKRFPPRRYCLTSFSAHASRSRNPRKRRPWRAAASASKHCAPLQSDRQVDVTQRLLVAQITTKEHHLPDAVRPGFIAIDGLDPRPGIPSIVGQRVRGKSAVRQLRAPTHCPPWCCARYRAVAPRPPLRSPTSEVCRRVDVFVLPEPQADSLPP